MATKCGRLFKTTSSISTIKSFISKPKLCPLSKPATTSFTRSTLPELNPPRRFSISRSPVELASMLPLHSAVATARMTSCLSASIGSCRALSQVRQKTFTIIGRTVASEVEM